jgi:cephalosporin hydroxylase
VRSKIKPTDKVLVTLDSNHSYDHVLKELELYAPLVSSDSYLVAMDGAQEWVWDIPRGKKEWKDDNPLRAIKDFLQLHPEWETDPHFTRFMITSSPLGFLRRKQKEA